MFLASDCHILQSLFHSYTISMYVGSLKVKTMNGHYRKLCQTKVLCKLCLSNALCVYGIHHKKH